LAGVGWFNQSRARARARASQENMEQNCEFFY